MDYENLNIIVVDNSEDRDEIAKIKALCTQIGARPEVFHVETIEDLYLRFNKDVYIIENSENKGFSGGNNVGIKLALRNSTDYIWILNNDTVVEKRTLKEMIETIQRYNADVVTCKMKDYKERDLVQYNGIKVYTDLFKKAGLLDEDFFLYFEDNEFHNRIFKNRAKILYTPYTHIYHKGSSSTGGFLRKPTAVYYFVRNNFLLHKKTGICKYEEAINIFYEVLDKRTTNKELLRAAVLGVFDFIKGRIGKREDIEDTVKRKNIDINTKDDLERYLELSFKYPRKREYIDAFINEVRRRLTSQVPVNV